MTIDPPCFCHCSDTPTSCPRCQRFYYVSAWQPLPPLAEFTGIVTYYAQKGAAMAQPPNPNATLMDPHVEEVANKLRLAFIGPHTFAAPFTDDDDRHRWRQVARVAIEMRPEEEGRVVDAAIHWLRGERREGRDPSFGAPGELADAVDRLGAKRGPRFTARKYQLGWGVYDGRADEPFCTCETEGHAEMIASSMNHTVGR